MREQKSPPEFISEPVMPSGEAFDTRAMAAGTPGLPRAFTWREKTLAILTCVGRWKGTSPEGGRAGKEVYLRRHYFELRMADDSTWTVYFVRQTPKSGSPKARWFLYTRAAVSEEE